MFALSCDRPLPPVVCFDETLLFPVHPPEGLSSETQFVLYKSVVLSEMQFVLYIRNTSVLSSETQFVLYKLVVSSEMQFGLYKACFHQKHGLCYTSRWFHMKCSLGYTRRAFIRNTVCVVQVVQHKQCQKHKTGHHRTTVQV